MISAQPTRERRSGSSWTLNVAIAAGFFVTAYLGDSNALLANGVDNSSDAVVYGLSLLALTRSARWKRGAARFSGVMLLIFAVGVMVDAVQRYPQRLNTRRCAHDWHGDRGRRP